MTVSDGQDETTAIAVNIADQVENSLQADRPLFLIVYYEHEAVKVAFLGKIRQILNKRGVTPQTFSPDQRPEHGAGRLYPLLEDVAKNGAVALVTDLPHLPDSAELDRSFLEYLNLHRDLIAKHHLRFVLFLHTADAERFISSAGDLWDFRHHTYWLEGSQETAKTSLWEVSERATTQKGLSEEEHRPIKEHMEQVHTLVQQTHTPLKIG